MKQLLAILLALVIAGQASAETTAPEPSTTTKTVERTITKTYTVTKRKLGLVGGRPYPAEVETRDGGVMVEKYVNDVKTDTQIIKPDTVAPLEQATDTTTNPNQYPFREYTTDARGSQIIKPDTAAFDATLRNLGSFND